jgi:hypothetical protein
VEDVVLKANLLQPWNSRLLPGHSPPPSEAVKGIAVTKAGFATTSEEPGELRGSYHTAEHHVKSRNIDAGSLLTVGKRR